MDGIEQQSRQQELLEKARYYRNQTFTAIKMSGYYGENYENTLQRAKDGEAKAYVLLGKMFEESVFHAMQTRDYDSPPAGYRSLAKIYYELAVLAGKTSCACTLGKCHAKDEEYEQAETWLLYAAKHHITDSYRALAELYISWYKKERSEKYLEQAQIWRWKDLENEEKKIVSQTDIPKWYHMADTCKSILTDGNIRDERTRQELVGKMAAYYQKVTEAPGDAMRIYACEELFAVYMGDYGTKADIEKAFLYGNIAIGHRTKDIACRMAEYLMEHQPQEWENIIYYLERGMDSLGEHSRCKGLLIQYIKEHDVPQYLRTEILLLTDAESFLELGRLYHEGKAVKKSLKTALYYYTRAREGHEIEKDIYIENAAYHFLKELEAEGTAVAKEAWKELERKRTQEPKALGFSEEVICLLADLNLRYHIIDMSAFQRQLKDIDFDFDTYGDQLFDFRSDFYAYGMMDKLDHSYLQEYMDCLHVQLLHTNEREQLVILYQDFVGLADYAACSTKAEGSLTGGLSKRIARKISDIYLEKILEENLRGKLTDILGQSEKEYRAQCHDAYMRNWPAALGRMKEIYPDFLEVSEEKWEKMDTDEER